LRGNHHHKRRLTSDINNLIRLAAFVKVKIPENRPFPEAGVDKISVAFFSSPGKETRHADQQLNMSRSTAEKILQKQSKCNNLCA
jgi:hypothetical protein